MRCKLLSIVATAMFLAGFNASFGQTNSDLSIPSKGDIEYSVGAGVSNSTDVHSTSGASSSTDNYLTGFNAYASAEYYLSTRWGIKAKLVYDQKGWKDNSSTDKFHLNYLTVPVIANWHFGRTRNWYLNFGPYAGFLLSNQLPADAESYYGIPPSKGINSIDGGLAFGIGVKIPLTNRVKFFIEMDGQSGFTNVLRDNNNDNDAYLARGSWNIGINF